MITVGDEPTHSTLVLRGMTARCAFLADGRREITAFHIAGDFVDLHSFPLKVLDHGIEAITDCTVMQFPHSNLMKITETEPHLTRMLWLLTLLDGAIHRQWLVVMGALTAEERMAHLFCEQYLRAEAAGLARDYAYPFPITKEDLGAAMGMSSVHTNRTLQRLRVRGLVQWRGGDMKIPDWERLTAFAGFDPTYLHLAPTQR